MTTAVNDSVELSIRHFVYAWRTMCAGAPGYAEDAAGADAGVALDACGLVPLMPLTGMIAQNVAPPSNVPSELQLARPQDDPG